ncbi:MAG TPA: MFS transporter [Streptosporangiaceae bacterium]|nr:MFS transporter [Streptosporangiaceae bacterium]
MRVYREFLRLPHAARLLGGTLLGRLPNGMGALAIVLFTRAHGGGYSLAGGLSAIWVVALALGQPTLGRAMDRLGQPRILFGGAVAAAGGFALLAVTGLEPLPVAIGAVIIAGFATPPLEAGLRALWPAVLPAPAQVRTAYAVDAATQELIFTVGPLLVVAAASVSAEAALIVTGLLGVAGTIVVTSSRPSQQWRGEPREAHWAGPLRSSGLRVLMATLALVGVALGAISVAVVTYADARHIAAASGVLLAANAGGALCGGLVHGARHGRRTAYPLLVGCLAVGYLPLAAAPAFPFMIVLAFLAGVSLAPALATAFTLVDALAPRGTVTEAFAWLVTAMALGAATGSALAGIAGDVAGAHAAFACAGAGGILALAVCLLGRGALAAGPRRATHTALPDAT